MSDVTNRARASASAVTITGVVEKVCVTVPPISFRAEDVVDIAGMLEVTPGSDATSLAIKVRRGTTIAGAQVGTTITVTVATAGKVSVPVLVSDQPGSVASQQYVVTATQAGGVADGACDTAAVLAIF